MAKGSTLQITSDGLVNLSRCFNPASCREPSQRDNSESPRAEEIIVYKPTNSKCETTFEVLARMPQCWVMIGQSGTNGFFPTVSSVHRRPKGVETCGRRSNPGNNKKRPAGKIEKASHQPSLIANINHFLGAGALRRLVFTFPRYLAPVVLQNEKIVYDFLFRASAKPF